MDNVVALSIKEWPQEERPRERCLSRGAAALSTTELVAILLRTGTKGKTALDLAREVLKEAGSLRGLASLAPGEVSRLATMGNVRAAQVCAAIELAKRFVDEEVATAETLSGAEEAYKFLKPRLRDLPHEVFAVIFLNQKHGVIAYRELFRGTISASNVHPREVVKESLKHNAAAVILAHNHPSGHVSPSPDDLRLTEDLRALLRHLDVRVVDHLIVGGNGYFSFSREGLLNS